jgi:hypothetical protein
LNLINPIESQLAEITQLVLVQTLRQLRAFEAAARLDTHRRSAASP